MASPRSIVRLEEVSGPVTLILCDIWGVLHNGAVAFVAAAAALQRARLAGKTVILLSNAPRPGSDVVPQLDRLGIPRDAYDGILTSGDICRDLIMARQPERFYHTGPPRDSTLFDGLNCGPVALADADYLLCSGLTDDTVETPDTYTELFKTCRLRNLPMLCANPDLIVDRGGTEIFCAGALAELYASMGGQTTVIGKPKAIAYERALAHAATLTGREFERMETLAIGDSMRTDIAGAAGYGLHSLFIAAGIHARDLLGPDKAIDPARLAHWLVSQPVAPDAVMRMLS